MHTINAWENTEKCQEENFKLPVNAILWTIVKIVPYFFTGFSSSAPIILKRFIYSFKSRFYIERVQSLCGYVGKTCLVPYPSQPPSSSPGRQQCYQLVCCSRSILWFCKQIHTRTHTFIFPCSFLCKWQHTIHLILSLAVVCLTIYTYHPFPCFCSHTVFQVWAFINNQTLVLYVYKHYCNE